MSLHAEAIAKLIESITLTIQIDKCRWSKKVDTATAEGRSGRVERLPQAKAFVVKSDSEGAYTEFGESLTVNAISTSHTSPAIPAHYWLIDSGAMSSVTPDRPLFTEHRPFRTAVRAADGRKVESAGVSTCIVAHPGRTFHAIQSTFSESTDGVH